MNMMPCLRKAAHTKRFHTHQTIGEQTVAEHSYHVAMLVMRIAGADCNSEMIKSALWHDLAEAATGDIPAPVKWANPDLNHMLISIEERFDEKHGLIAIITEDEQRVVKMADSIELAQYALDQMMLGNRNMLAVYHNIMEHIQHRAIWPKNSAWVSSINIIIEELEGRLYDYEG